MELVVFDLDGTLLNRRSSISEDTATTLRQLADRGIAYTVATGRTLHGARDLLVGHGFELPFILKNGAMIWQPDAEDYSHKSLLTLEEIGYVVEVILKQDITPFIFTLGDDNHHIVYHVPLQSESEERLVRHLATKDLVRLFPVSQLPAEAKISNISAIGPLNAIEAIEHLIADETHLVAFAGTALEGGHLGWIDIHHSDASKGGAIEQLKQELGFTRVICFGDSDNDLSMFAMADESYAPANAKPVVKEAATAVIGHHDEDGIAEFLRQRFELE